jgi:hypothetical protein
MLAAVTHGNNGSLAARSLRISSFPGVSGQQFPSAMHDLLGNGTPDQLQAFRCGHCLPDDG